MRIVNQLRSTRRGWVLLSKPEEGGGNPGPAAEAPKTESSASDEKMPEITGETLEAKVTSAGGIIKSLWDRLTSALSASKKAEGERDGLQTQFDALTKTAQAEKDEHTKTKGLLADEQKAHGTTKDELDKSGKNVTRLETLCDLKGIDKNQVVKPAASATGGDKKQEYLDLKAKENKGEVARGTASKFYNKHKKEIEG